MTQEDHCNRPNRPVILVVDDEPGVRKLVVRALEAVEPAALLEAADGIEAQRLLSEHPVDVAITDVLMPRLDGLGLMRWAQQQCPGPMWIVLSGVDTFGTAVDALQLGAFDFLSKPLVLQQVRVSVRNALDRLALVHERERLHRELEQSHEHLARKVADLERLCRMLEDQSEVIQADLARAEVIQRALLPQAPPRIDGWCVETLYRPGNNVGGDFYDIVHVDDRHLGVVIADAAGHGVAAAMLSVLFKHRLKLRDDQTQALLMPNEVLRRVNRALHTDAAAPGSFITAAYMLIDRRLGHLRMASAGHPPCVFLSAAGASRLLPRTGPALGLEADARYGEHALDLGPGDRLLLYTDGVVEGGATTPTQDDLIRALGRASEDRGKLLTDLFEAATRDVTADPDDITMVLLERREGVSRFDDGSRPRTGATPGPAPLRLLQGVAGGRAYISIAGTGTWMRSQVFYEAALAALERRRGLTLDLGACERLDSTFLGTLYEIVTTDPEAVRLQRVPRQIRALFEELSMQAVLSRVALGTEPLPASMKVLDQARDSAALEGERLLKAHETLAALSDENDRQFREVVESLRSDLDGRRT